MGLTNRSVGMKAVDSGLQIRKRGADDWVVALAGNPNVGKSTVFNGLTGMNQHTGNWPGKTVSNAQGCCSTKKHSYVMVDIPGTYSLMAHSAEEEVARNFICFGEPDAVVVVCDATCLERNMNLVLQTMEIYPRVIVCVNLLDEAKRKKISIDLKLLSKKLGMPVVGIVARQKKSLGRLMSTIDRVIDTSDPAQTFQVDYHVEIEMAIGMIEPRVNELSSKKLSSRWLSLKLLDQDQSLIEEINTYLGEAFLADTGLTNAVKRAQEYLNRQGIGSDELKDLVVAALVAAAETVCEGVVICEAGECTGFDRKADRILTSRRTGYPVMLLLLALTFWLTIVGANYPSQILSDGLFWLQDRLTVFFDYVNAPVWLHSVLVQGIYRVVAWVVSVMLPPMGIFFPLFTLLEDIGYLPRIAYNLDKPFKRCCACGKQALTMCMGFGCNAAGIVGCRIIDSPRERLLAILTNNFVPCNGRFPALISIIIMFFAGVSGGVISSVFSVVLLTAVILLGIGTTLAVTKLLSMTLLKGMPSSYTLELPSYRKPQVGKVIVRSVFDRTLFVLGRAVAVAVPAGLLIWLAANIKAGDISILNHCASFLDPFARLMGLDGVILMAFILGFPANEIVIPIIIMVYLAQGSILEMESLVQMKELFTANGWTWATAVSFMLFTLMHWPCSTALLTIKKETGSIKWTVLAAALPTVIGILLCIFFTSASGLFL